MSQFAECLLVAPALIMMWLTGCISAPVHDWLLTGDVVQRVQLQPSSPRQKTRERDFHGSSKNELQRPDSWLVIGCCPKTKISSSQCAQPLWKQSCLGAVQVSCWMGASVTVKWWLIWGKEAWPLIFALNKVDCACLVAPLGLIVRLPERHLSPITEYKAVEYIMQIIRLETNTSSAFPQRKRQPSLMSRVKLEYSYLFPSAETIEWFAPPHPSLPSLYPTPLFFEASVLPAFIYRSCLSFPLTSISQSFFSFYLFARCLPGMQW